MFRVSLESCSNTLEDGPNSITFRHILNGLEPRSAGGGHRAGEQAMDPRCHGGRQMFRTTVVSDVGMGLYQIGRFARGLFVPLAEEGTTRRGVCGRLPGGLSKECAAPLSSAAPRVGSLKLGRLTTRAWVFFFAVVLGTARAAGCTTSAEPASTRLPRAASGNPHPALPAAAARRRPW